MLQRKDKHLREGEREIECGERAMLRQILDHFFSIFNIINCKYNDAE